MACPKCGKEWGKVDYIDGRPYIFCPDAKCGYREEVKLPNVIDLRKKSDTKRKPLRDKL